MIAKRNEISALQETIEKYRPQLEKYKAAKDVDSADLLATYTSALKSDVSVMKERLSAFEAMSAQEEAKSKELVNFELNENIIGSQHRTQAAALRRGGFSVEQHQLTGKLWEFRERSADPGKDGSARLAQHVGLRRRGDVASACCSECSWRLDCISRIPAAARCANWPRRSRSQSLPRSRGL